MFCVWGRRIRTKRICKTEMTSVCNGRVQIVTPLCKMLLFQHFRIANQHIYCLLQAILYNFPPYLYSLLLQLQPELWKTLSMASFISHLTDRADPTLEHEAATLSSDLPLNPRNMLLHPLSLSSLLCLSIQHVHTQAFPDFLLLTCTQKQT